MSGVIPLAKRTIPFVLLIAVFYFFTHSGRPYADDVILRFKDSKTVFVDSIIDNDLPGSTSDGSALQELCSSRDWHENRVMSCETGKEGVTSVRQWQLQCIRVAIEAGATTVILPSIVQRKDRYFQRGKRAHAPLTGVAMDYMFDFHHLNDTLGAHCPRIKLATSISDFHDVYSLLGATNFKLGDPVGMDEKSKGAEYILPKPEEWAPKFDTWVEEQQAKAPPTSHLSDPYRLHFMASKVHFPVYHDSAQIRRDLSAALRFRRDARVLASAALYRLVSKYGVNLDPHKATVRTGFAGIHMRLELDVQEGKAKNAPDFAYQASESVKYVSGTGLSLAFLASGGPQEKTASFIEGAREFNLTVLTKDMLLDDKEKAQLRSFSYDQQAIVDYEIMRYATRMVGIGVSTFSSDLALVRADMYSDMPIEDTPEPDSTMMWHDDFTSLIWRIDGVKWSDWVKSWWP